MLALLFSSAVSVLCDWLAPRTSLARSLPLPLAGWLAGWLTSQCGQGRGFKVFHMQAARDRRAARRLIANRSEGLASEGRRAGLWALGVREGGVRAG